MSSAGHYGPDPIEAVPISILAEEALEEWAEVVPKAVISAIRLGSSGEVRIREAGPYASVVEVELWVGRRGWRVDMSGCGWPIYI